MSTWQVGRIEDIAEFASIAGEGLQFFDESIWLKYVDRIGIENCRGVWQDGRYVGGLAFYRMGQWYGGAPVSCAGVSGVAIDPADRGSGACKALLVDLLNELHSERMPLACLYASTQRLYRSVGFEQSGHSFTYSLPISSLDASRSARGVAVRRTMEPDSAQLTELNRYRARLHNGNLERTVGLWERIFSPIGQSTSTYLIGEDGAYEGYVVLHHGKRENGYPQSLVASDWVATTVGALQRIVTIIRDHRSMCDAFQWNGGPQDDLLLSASEQRTSIKSTNRTLSRIVTLPDALEQRGYPKHVSGALEINVQDALLNANNGNWVVELDSGKAKVSRGGTGAVRISIEDLVPLYASLMTASQLQHLKRLEAANAAQLALADAAFAGPAPWTSEMF